MTVHRLTARSVSKPWGITDVPSAFQSIAGDRAGEVWFTHAPMHASTLLVKYLFTSEKLSVQVHPNDADARAVGLPRGKSECWYVVEAEADARLGIGLLASMDTAKVRSAALDGSLQDLLDWRPVSAGSFFYIPAGTIHAVGAGLQIVEIQQSADVTYRLYDYGRPRELHLERGLAIAQLGPYRMPHRMVSALAHECLVQPSDAPFSVDSIVGANGDTFTLADDVSWFVPLTGQGLIDGHPWTAGECWVSDGPCDIAAGGPMHALVARVSS
ncbi:class I mannose-6-phosphate isomerase [Novosphingobium sp.]|uniref:class I mannose-6-phosphate isomerase n=1 Tax=Novosphingobium sp. TaxID=1874826 RepID=UPI0028A7DC70|nr:class I mannose-6-phosphate isomerase [Novosphingobium sp.]